MRDEKAWKWLNENQLSYDIWVKKYRQNNESFDEWLDRITGGNEEYKRIILEKLFLPAGRVLSNRGLYKYGTKVTYSNCYVQSPPEDSIESIFDCAKEIARTYSYGGGVGVDISKLAPKNAKVNNAAKNTSGAVSFMELYSTVTGLIGQNGRRGALMISIDCHHPDLEEFIDIKTDLNKVNEANISIKITDDFMKAVQDDTDFELYFLRKETGEEIKKTVKARDIFHKICENNWNYAEPGMLFWDRINEWNLLSNNEEFSYAGVNPCAEEPLPAGGSCLLGSLNLSEFVEYPFTPDACVNNHKLIESVKIAVRFLNEILDEGLDLHPLEMQQQTVNDWRQIGLGIMGVADMLIKCGIEYGSEEAIELCDCIGRIIIDTALEESAILASKSSPYPMCEKYKILTTQFINSNASKITQKLIEEYGLRNSQLLTIAPTGSLSTMLGISGGIEPIFAKSYTRKTESLHGEDKYYKVYTPIVEQYMKANNLEDESDLPDYFVTSKDIEPINRIKMQAVFQDHIDASISSTINLPNECTVEDVEEIYMYAWEYGLKGITIYRTGCAREGILVEENKSNEEIKEDNSLLTRGQIINVSDDLVGCKRKLMTGCGSLHLEVYSNEVTGEPQETFINIGSGGGCERNYQFISRLISLALRGGIPIEDIIDQAKSIRPCPAYINRTKSKGDTSPGTSCPTAIGHALQELYSKTKKLYDTDGNINNNKSNGTVCPDCGESMEYEGGCVICKHCGYSKCD